jgi:very-short-patch-repair endonuclease
MAATLAAGHESMVAGRAAADLWGFRDHQGPIEVVRAESRKPREFWLDGEGVVGKQRVVVRRSRHLPVADRARIHGIPVMNVARLFVDLSASLSDKALADSFKRADLKGKLNEKDLVRCAGLGRGWKGIRRYRALVERRHPKMKQADSYIEGLMWEIDRDFVRGNPVAHRPFGKYYADFYYEDCDLLVETDGAEFHSGRMAFLDDSWRENDLREKVRQVIRFSTEEIIGDPERVGRIIRRERKKCFRLKYLEELEAAGAASERLSA